MTKLNISTTDDLATYFKSRKEKEKISYHDILQELYNAKQELEMLKNSGKLEDSDDTTPDDNEPVLWFTNVSGKTVEEREEKLNEIKEALEVDPENDIVLTRQELYKKASEISGKSISEIEKEGSDSYAQKLITSYRKQQEGQGIAGSADSRIKEAYDRMIKMIETGKYKPRNGKFSPTKLRDLASQELSTNYNSVKDWIKRNDLAEKFGIDD